MVELRLIPDGFFPSDETPLEELSGSVHHITFRNDDNGYTVARFNTENSGLITITGKFAQITEGEQLILFGRWKQHPKFGLQFEATSYQPTVPSTLKGMEKYLASGLIPGIGPSLAKEIVKHFGNEVFKVIEETPERLKEVPGIGKVKSKSLIEAFKSQKAIRTLMMFLQEHDISSTLAIKIFKEYGNDSIRVLKTNPYELANDIFGVGFKTADRVARKLGIDKDDPRRISAGLIYVLKEASDNGHCYLPKIELLRMAGELLESDINALERSLSDLIKSSDLMPDGENIYLEFLYRAEELVAKVLGKLSTGKLKNFNREKFYSLINKIQDIDGLNLAPEQLKAVEAAYVNQCMVMTGGPGTGKSTTIRIIVRLFEQLNKNVRLASPTGRAAKRLEEATGRPASTIHRLLEYKPQRGFERNADNPLDCKVLIIDEASMVDLPLAYYLLRAIPAGCRLILVGDVDQLPSVGPGSVLKDIIESGVIPTVRLTEIFRQAQGSLIVINAHRINMGQKLYFDPDAERKDFIILKEENREIIGDRIIELVRDKLSKKFNPLSDIQVLSPMHAGSAGAVELNRRLQETCNPPSKQKPEIKHGDRTFRLGDRVMQIKNNYELDVFNGDIGCVVSVDPRAGTLTVRYDRDVHYSRSDLDELQLAYAITVHKSQGSEYQCVVIPMTSAHWVMLQRNLLYTAVTRAKKFCILVGQNKAIYRAISNARIGERYSGLKARLINSARGG